MKTNKIFKVSIGFLFGILFFACTEEIELITKGFEDILVINANITDEEVVQKVILSRTFEVGAVEKKEVGATVIIIDDLGNNFQFIDMGEGTYISENPFAAQVNRIYNLVVTTNDGNVYTSDPVKSIGKASLENVRAETMIDDNGTDGIGIRVDSFDPEGIGNYFRYEYEETYLIESKFSSLSDLAIISQNPPRVEIIAKTREERICYKTEFSNEILITNTSQNTLSRVSNFQIKFIPKDDFSIRERYSILVRQYTQSREANAFYQSLKEFSSNENIFTQTQPGFINGNIKSINEQQKVLGFFEISSVTTKRLFFNYSDIYPDGNKPRYPIDCDILMLTELDLIIDILQVGRFRFFSFDFISNEYTLISAPCVDCNELGTNVKPDFWID